MNVDVQRLVVIVLALAALLLQGGLVPHHHVDAHPGFFDHDHDITALAGGSGGLVPSGPDVAPALIAFVLVATPSVAVRALAPRRHADPRAPLRA